MFSIFGKKNKEEDSGLGRVLNEDKFIAQIVLDRKLYADIMTALKNYRNELLELSSSLKEDKEEEEYWEVLERTIEIGHVIDSLIDQFEGNM